MPIALSDIESIKIVATEKIKEKVSEKINEKKLDDEVEILTKQVNII